MLIQSSFTSEGLEILISDVPLHWIRLKVDPQIYILVF